MKTIIGQIFFPALLSVLLTSSYGQTNNKINKTNNLLIDTSNFAILKFDKSYTWLFKNAKATNLTLDEIDILEKILSECIEIYNPRQRKEFDKISKEHPEYNLKLTNFIIDLTRYKRQYVPVINSAGQKLVWINCSCYQLDKQWKKEIIIVKDGGNCYFSVIINLSTKTYSRLIVNGDA